MCVRFFLDCFASPLPLASGESPDIDILQWLSSKFQRGIGLKVCCSGRAMSGLMIFSADGTFKLREAWAGRGNEEGVWIGRS